MSDKIMQAVDGNGNPVDLGVLEETETAFDPTTQHLDLSKDEKRRTTALMMAIQGYKELIIKEAAYLHEVADLARRGEGPKLGAATIDGMVDAAIKFDAFIAGRYTVPAEVTRGGAQTEAGTEVAEPAETQEP